MTWQIKIIVDELSNGTRQIVGASRREGKEIACLGYWYPSQMEYRPYNDRLNDASKRYNAIRRD